MGSFMRNIILRKIKLLFYQSIVIGGFYILTGYLKAESKNPYAFMISAAATVVFTIIAIADLLQGPWKEKK